MLNNKLISDILQTHLIWPKGSILNLKVEEVNQGIEAAETGTTASSHPVTLHTITTDVQTRQHSKLVVVAAAQRVAEKTMATSITRTTKIMVETLLALVMKMTGGANHQKSTKRAVVAVVATETIVVIGN